MADVKEYAYYIEGSSLALVERDVEFDNDPNSKDYGPGTDKYVWKSPLSSVTDGLELQYTYAPIYNVQSSGTDKTDYHQFLGWGSDRTNLVLFAGGQGSNTANSYQNLSSLFQADDYIHIEGSDRWSGLHQVKETGGTTGVLTLKTRCNLKPSKITVTGGFSGSTNQWFTGDTTDFGNDIDRFKDTLSARTTPWIWIDNAATAANGGFHQSSLTGTYDGRIVFDGVQRYLNTTGDVVEESDVIVNGTNDEVTIYNAFYNPMTVRENIEVMTDESFELDLPTYLQKAVVYYIKAKMSEDLRDVQGREYFNKLFLKQVEKHNSARVSGLRIVSPGPNALR